MKLLVVSHTYSKPVNQRLVAELAKESGWEIDLVIPRNWHDEFGNKTNDPPLPELAKHTLEVPVFFNGSIILHTYRMRWRRFLNTNRYDIIYVNHEPYAVATAQICRANLRANQRATFGFYSCQNIVKKYPFPFATAERMVYRNSDFTLPITNAVSDVLTHKGFQGRHQVVPLPIDLAIYYSPEIDSLTTSLHSTDDTCHLGFVGRIVKEKGLATLAQALGFIKNLSWKLTVVGAGSDEENFRSQLHEQGILNRVHFTGYVPHERTPDYLRSFDLLVLPSETQPNWKEQFGRVILEAIACGTPVVGSSSGEIPTLIRASQGGVVFQEKDPQDLARVLAEWISDPRRRSEAVQIGRDWVSQNVSLKAVAKQMIETFQQAYTSRLK